MSVALLALGGRASAVDVSFALSTATTQACSEEYDGYYGYYWSCSDPAVPMAIEPSAPQGTGSTIDLDVNGRPFGGSVAIEAHQIGGVAVPAWSRTFVPLGTGGAIRTVSDSGVGPWPSEDDGSATLTLSRFASQSDFAGSITVRWEEVQRDPQGVGTLVKSELVYAFSTLGSGAIACAGDEIWVDDDRDGEKNSRDRFPNSANARILAIDADGATIAEFCAANPAYPTGACRRADFRNDEPRRGNPRDCRRLPDASPQCRPAEIFGTTPLPTLRSCLGLSVVDDVDADGEPDGTDHCASTPAGQAVDGDGCSAAQFCAAQSYAACRRSDWRNDEPLSKAPRDCTRTRQPRACTAAGL